MILLVLLLFLVGLPVFLYINAMIWLWIGEVFIGKSDDYIDAPYNN